MWFQFPEGSNAITVQQQSFKSEAKDVEGREYFRAPEHFADIILGIAGFSIKEPPDCDLPDLPQADPLRDGAIGDLAKKLDVEQETSRRLREDLNSLSAEFFALKAERDKLNTTLEAEQRRVAALEERLNELESPAETAEATAAKSTKK